MNHQFEIWWNMKEYRLTIATPIAAGICRCKSVFINPGWTLLIQIISSSSTPLQKQPSKVRDLRQKSHPPSPTSLHTRARGTNPPPCSAYNSPWSPSTTWAPPCSHPTPSLPSVLQLTPYSSPTPPSSPQVSPQKPSPPTAATATLSTKTAPAHASPSATRVPASPRSPMVGS